MKPHSSAAAYRAPEAVPFSSIFGLARHVTVAGVAGLVTGVLVGGLGGRVFMRIAGAANPATRGRTTEAGFIVGRITLDGTLGLVIFVGLFVGAVGAVLYVIFRPWLHRAGKWRGAAFGVVLFGIGSATSDVLNPDNIDFQILGNPLLLVAMIFGLFVAFGILLDWLFGVLNLRMPDDGRPTARVVYTVLALLGLGLAVLLVPFTLFTDQACDCQPPLIASSFVLVTGAGTAVRWWNGLHEQKYRPVARMLGLIGLGGTLVFGLIRAVSDAIDIIR